MADKKKKDGSKSKDKPSKASAPLAAAEPVEAGGESASPAAAPQDALEAATLYKDLYDELGKVYWQASDMETKDAVQGIRDGIYAIITQLNQEQLDANTEAYASFKKLIEKTNASLTDLEEKVDKITKNIATAAKVVAAITKVLGVAAKF